MRNATRAVMTACLTLSGAMLEPAAARGAALDQLPQREAYFGDLHVHTQLSFDAFIFGTRTGPDEAYRFGRGETIQHPAGFDMKLDRPLDFLAVTDHVEFLGRLPALLDPASAAESHPLSELLREATSPAQISQIFEALVGGDAVFDEHIEPIFLSAWQRVIEAANRHYVPGEFTTFIGYEYTTSGPGMGNLHRNVIFRDEAVPDVPFTSLDSPNPEDLWDWLDREREQGREALAIPHNSNGSNGLMFAATDTAGEAIDRAYAEQRMRNEPLVEVTQVKGTSETHPALSPNDEWAHFEIFPYRIATTLESEPKGSYVRDAYRLGIEMERAQGFNPYRFGLIGASDTHVSAGSFDESNFWSKLGLPDATPELRGSVPAGEQGSEEYADTFHNRFGASGLAGVWAESNTRGAIYAALRRKETFATSGPRIKVRFFGGQQLPDDLLDRGNAVQRAYAAGVSMGGDLIDEQLGEAPRFFVWALRDPLGAPLQRAQIVKGWVDADGRSHEQVYDVACSDRIEADPESHRCPDNGARVSLDDCRVHLGTGANELRALWEDPDFDASQPAFYYVRVLQNPTCRWSTWDAIRAGVEPHPDLPRTIQERAWSSPIWYRPLSATAHVIHDREQ